MDDDRMTHREYIRQTVIYARYFIRPSKYEYPFANHEDELEVKAALIRTLISRLSLIVSIVALTIALANTCT